MGKGKLFTETISELSEGIMGAASSNAKRSVARRQSAKLIRSGVVKDSRQALRQGTKQAEKIMQSNNYKIGAAIGNAKMFNGITDSFKAYEHPKVGAIGAIKAGHMNAKGGIDPFKVAGTAATIGIAGRVVTGGGLYRDRYGNFNLPGVPFI